MSSSLKLGYSIMILLRLHHSLSITSYSFINHLRNSIGGGTGIILKEEYKLISNKTIPLQSCEQSKFTIKTKSQLLIKMIALYRPPSSNFDTFIEDFNFIISPLIDISTIVTGDFNIHMKSNNNKSKTFIKSLKTNNLSQHVNCPTHHHGNTLYLIITRTSYIIIQSVFQSTLFLDNFFINFPLKLKKYQLLNN